MEPIITVPVISGVVVVKCVMAFFALQATVEVCGSIHDFLKEGKADADGTGTRTY